MDELLQQVSDQTGIPVDMLERAASARADATGTSAEAVVAGWAGAEVPVAGPAEAAAVAPAAAPTITAAPAAAPAPALAVEVLESEAPAPAPEPEPEPEPVPAGPGMPRWLSAAFIVVPFIAILYALNVPNGPDCGNAGRLDVDPVTGIAVNCDGSAFGAVASFFTVGQAVYEAYCAQCHASNGGGGIGPALAGGSVVATFSSCADHVEWVTLGAEGWPGPTYGDLNKPKAFMSGFEGDLDGEELASVVLYERVAFGGLDVTEAEPACGLGEAETTALGG